MPINIIPFFSSIASPCLIDTHSRYLLESGARVIKPDDFMGTKKREADLLTQQNIIFVGTGGTENKVADFIRENDLRSPIIIMSHPSNNSLPASMEIRAYLDKNGFPAALIHLPLDGLVMKLRRWVEFSEHLEMLRKSRIGLIGKPSFWLIASDIDFEKATNRWGVAFEKFDLSVLKTEATITTANSIESEFKAGSSKIEIPATEIEKASRVAAVLNDFIQEHHLRAVTLQCFDYLVETEVSGCLALSHVNNQPGQTAGCEGDIPTTFTMLLARILTGSPSFMANVIDVDLENNAAVFAHCTVATSLVKNYEITTHFETGKSVGIRGSFEKERVTVFKVFGDELLDYWVSGGTIEENLREEECCRTQIRVNLDEDVSYFLDESLANHHVIIPGDHAEIIEDFFSYVYLRE